MAGAKPDENLAIVSPWQGLGTQRGAVVFWIKKSLMVPEPQAYLPLISAVGEIVARFQARRKLLYFQNALAQTQQINAFAASLHTCLDARQTAYAIANDGRTLIDCDRLSVVLRSGSQWKVLAISGAEHVHRHSPSAHSLQALCRCVTVTGVPLWHSLADENLPPQIADSLADYLDHSPATSLAVIPLLKPIAGQGNSGQVIGALVIEYYKQDIAAEVKDKVLMIAKHCAIALDKAARLDRVPGIRLGLWFANHRWTEVLGTRTLVAITTITIALICLAFIPADIRIRAHGELMPTIRREVFAPRDAVITKVLIEHGQAVESGQPLLGLRSTDLELEVQLVEGELQQARKRLSVTQSERLQLPPGDADARNRQRRLTADEEQYQQQVASLEARLEILRKHLQQLVVTAPIAGQVLTWNAQERLATRPVQRGEALLSVADTSGDWQAELQVPGRHAGRLVNSYNAKPANPDADSNDILIASSTAPGTWIRGKISRISSRVQDGVTGNVYLPVTVSFSNDSDSNPIPLVPGATVVARIGCGRGSLAESLFFELADAVRLWIPF
jgi:multidrug efflux pump subunit AcrA (membrane-fusion protein)